MVEVRCVDDAGGLRALEPLWNALLQRSGSDSICMTWEWIWTWWEVYGARYRPLVLVASDAGREIGIAPLMVGRGTGRITAQVRYLMFIGQNEDVTPEYLDFFVERGREGEVTEAFCRHLVRERRGDWDVALLQRILRDSPNLKSLAAACQRQGLPVARTAEVECPYATLPSGWQEYLQGRSKHFRKRIGYNRRRLEREGALALQHVDRETDLGAAFDRLVELNRERWGTAGESFRSQRYVAFHRRLCELLLPRGWLLLVLLTVDGRVAAAKYDYCYAGKVWGNQGGWLPDFEKQEIGSVLVGMLLEWAIEQGYREYDFLGGEAEYKRRWGDGLRMMDDYQVWNTTARARLLRAGRQGRDWAASTAVPWVHARLPGRLQHALARVVRLPDRNG